MSDGGVHDRPILGGVVDDRPGPGDGGLGDRAGLGADVGDRGRFGGGLLGRRWVPLLVVALLLAGIVAEAFALGHEGGSNPTAPRATVDAARRFALAITSFDHRHLDADIARVLALGTPDFERDFRQTVGPNFTAQFTKNQTVSVGDLVAGPRVQGVKGGRAQFAVVVDQRITSDAQKDASPQVSQLLLLVTVQEKDNRVTAAEQVYRS